MQVLAQALNELDAVVTGSGSGIPRHFHFTARSKALTGDFGDNIRRIQALHPGWTLTVHDDQDIVAFLGAEFGPAVLEVYRRIADEYGAARADFFRYCCLYRWGGVYLDSKSSTASSLDDWLLPDDQFILSQWAGNGPGEKYEGWGLHEALGHVPGGEYQQWFIIAAPGHPFLKAVIARVMTNLMQCGPVPPRFGREGVFFLTGPIAYTLAIQPLRPRWPHRLVDIESLGVQYTVHGGERTHYQANGPHYSMLRTSVVRLEGWRQRLFVLSREARLRATSLQGQLIRALSKIKRLTIG